MNYNTKFTAHLKLVFERVYCPKCDKQMKKIMSPWLLGWRCSDCRYITWYDINKWGTLFDNFTRPELKSSEKKRRDILKDYKKHILTAFMSFLVGLLLAMVLL